MSMKIADEQPDGSNCCAYQWPFCNDNALSTSLYSVPQSGMQIKMLLTGDYRYS